MNSTAVDTGSDEHGKSLKTRHALTLAAIGIVFGDIGTSPLYSMKEVFG